MAEGATTIRNGVDNAHDVCLLLERLLRSHIFKVSNFISNLKRMKETKQMAYLQS